MLIESSSILDYEDNIHTPREMSIEVTVHEPNPYNTHKLQHTTVNINEEATKVTLIL